MQGTGQKGMGSRILIVEDNPVNLELIVQLLEDDYEILTATDGVAAVEMAIAEAPDLILLDISLPKQDGFEAASQLRKHPSTSKVPIVAVTAHATKGDRIRIKEAGFDGYVPKPIDEDQLFSRVAELLASSGADV
jgi:CheY-like chemotaxis protein